MPFVIIARLRVDAAAVQTRTTEIAGPTLRIGRGTGNDLHLEDPSVQFNHAIIQESAGTYTLRDLNAVSLTTVNGVSVKEAVLSGEGTIRIGPYEFRYSRQGSQAPLTLEYEMPAPASGDRASAGSEAASAVAGKVETPSDAGQAP